MTCKSYVHGRRMQCWSSDMKCGNAAVWFNFFLNTSNMAEALFVSTCTASNLLANSFSSSTRTNSKKSKCLAGGAKKEKKYEENVVVNASFRFRNP